MYLLLMPREAGRSRFPCRYLNGTNLRETREYSARSANSRQELFWFQQAWDVSSVSAVLLRWRSQRFTNHPGGFHAARWRFVL